MYVVGWLTDNMYAINLRDQTLRWHIHVNGESTEALYAANGVLYIDTSANAIHALRADNGTQLWNRNNFSLQLIDNDILYSFAVDSNGSITNDLYALRSSDGTTVWHIQIGSPNGKVAASHMTLYVITDTMLYALRANDRSILWQTSISGDMEGPIF
jgi:outer membrane protein assembly factor BamB